MNVLPNKLQVEYAHSRRHNSSLLPPGYVLVPCIRAHTFMQA